MSAAGPPQGARPPGGGGAKRRFGESHTSAAGPPQGARPLGGGGAKRRFGGGHTSRFGGGVPLVILLLSGCAAPNLVDAPKIVQGHPVPSYQIHEECFALKARERVEYRFESTEPVDFNIHYHEGNAVVMPLVREQSREDAGIYSASIAQDYCLMWEAGAAGATIDYRIRVRRPES